MRNQRGFITADFMFSIVLIFGLVAVLFSITFTFVAASITQYITFAAARNYVAGHLSQDMQNQRAQAKYTELMGNQVFAPLFSNGWFQISKQPDVVGDASQLISGYQANGTDPNLFFGVGTYFTASILDFQVPFFGATSTDPGNSAQFKTFMGSYLGRDVTTSECIDFVKQRWTNIQNISGSSYSTAQGQNYYPFTDDGC
jgi:hypothetical protein